MQLALAVSSVQNSRHAGYVQVMHMTSWGILPSVAAQEVCMQPCKAEQRQEHCAVCIQVMHIISLRMSILVWLMADGR